MVSQVETSIRVAEIFAAWLKENHQRMTPERMAILLAIYERSDHFDADTLLSDLRKSYQNVSRATVYNTLDLLQACNLIRKHQFDSSQALYEKSYGHPGVGRSLGAVPFIKIRNNASTYRSLWFHGRQPFS